MPVHLEWVVDVQLVDAYHATVFSFQSANHAAAQPASHPTSHPAPQLTSVGAAGAAGTRGPRSRLTVLLAEQGGKGGVFELKLKAVGFDLTRAADDVLRPRVICGSGARSLGSRVALSSGAPSLSSDCRVEQLTATWL